MLGNWKKPLGWVLGLGLATICTPAWAVPTVPQPGALNYVEGQASIDNSVVTSKSVGSAVLNAGDVLSTGNGRAEILLTPGVFMRVDKNSSVRMIAPELTNTRVEVLQGQAMVEADIVHKEDHIVVAERGATAELDKKGVYDFNANAGTIRVFDGQATVTEGDHQTDVKKDKQVMVDAPKLKAQKFDKDSAQASDPLYSWSKLRSEYLAEATASTAQTYIVDNGGWYGPGWYWNPWWSMYSFVPGDGFFYSPFGFGLYSPVYLYSYGGVYPHGFYGRGLYARGVAPSVRTAPAVRAGGFGNGFRGGFAGGGGFHGGGFHR
jgi:hypothetical protein